MNLQQLEYACAVAETGHFGRAAERCHVTQPTLSTMLARLEDELGIQLFERGKGPATPTPHGAQVVQRARDILAAVQHLRAFAAGTAQDIAGPVRLGVIPTLAPYVVPPLLARLMDAHPALDVTVEETVTRDVEARLLAHTLDVALVATPPDDARINAQRLGYDEFVLYHHLPHEDARALAAALPALQHLPWHRLWLLQDVHCFRGQVLDFCAAQGLGAPPRLRYEAGSIATLVQLVDQLQGFTFLPRLAIPTLLPAQQSRVISLGAAAPRRPLYLLSMRTYPRVRLLAALAAAMQPEVGVGNSKP